MDVVHLGGDDQAGHEGGSLAAAVRTGEQASLSPGAVLNPIDKLVEELSGLLLLVATAAGAFELLVRIPARL